MTSKFIDSRRDLRERAFQTLFSLEFGGQLVDATQYTYEFDKPISEDKNLDIPLFLLQLVQGVDSHKEELDKEISAHLKNGWSLDRLTRTDKTLLRLGLYEIKFYEETPDRVALNEIIDMAKKYSDKTSAKFVNGLLSQFVTENSDDKVSN